MMSEASEKFHPENPGSLRNPSKDEGSFKDPIVTVDFTSTRAVNKSRVEPTTISLEGGSKLNHIAALIELRESNTFKNYCEQYWIVKVLRFVKTVFRSWSYYIIYNVLAMLLLDIDGFVLKSLYFVLNTIAFRILSEVYDTWELNFCVDKYKLDNEINAMIESLDEKLSVDDKEEEVDEVKYFSDNDEAIKLASDPPPKKKVEEKVVDPTKMGRISKRVGYTVNRKQKGKEKETQKKPRTDIAKEANRSGYKSRKAPAKYVTNVPKPGTNQNRFLPLLSDDSESPKPKAKASEVQFNNWYSSDAEAKNKVMKTKRELQVDMVKQKPIDRSDETFDRTVDDDDPYIKPEPPVEKPKNTVVSISKNEFHESSLYRPPVPEQKRPTWLQHIDAFNVYRLRGGKRRKWNDLDDYEQDELSIIHCMYLGIPSIEIYYLFATNNVNKLSYDTYDRLLHTSYSAKRIYDKDIGTQKGYNDIFKLWDFKYGVPLHKKGGKVYKNAFVWFSKFSNVSKIRIGTTFRIYSALEGKRIKVKDYAERY